MRFSFPSISTSPVMGKLTLAKDQMAEDKEPAGLALDGDPPLHRRIIARRNRMRP